MADWPTTFHDFEADEELESGWLDDLVAALQAANPVGKYDYILAASTSSENLVNGAWLECNGASVLRADYPDLNTLLNSLGYPFGTADGTHMTLPDFRGRAPWGHGSHANAQLGDDDGVAESSRQAKHTHTDSLSAASGGSHTHSYDRSSTTTGVATGPTNISQGAQGATTGSGGSHSHSISGSVGSGMNGSDAVAHQVGGSWFVKAKP